MAKVTVKKKDDAPGTLGEVRGYARKIWLAGIGAYARVGGEGSDYFNELVKAGEGVEKRGKKRIDKELDAANNQIDEATQRSAAYVARSKFNWTRSKKLSTRGSVAP